MGRCSIQIVMGPAGSGKSTYCHAIQQHAQHQQKFGPPIQIINLDPAAEFFCYEPLLDIRDIISVTDVMEEVQLGPNGALVYCMEYFLENGLDWLQEQLDTLSDDDYVILDCPGQIELYTHIPVQRKLIDTLKMWGYEGSMVSVFCIDAGFLIDTSKFIAGSLLSLSAMIALELPHVTLLTKCDLMKEEEIEKILNYGSASEIWNREEYKQSLYRTTNPTTTRTTTRTEKNPSDLSQQLDHEENPSQQHQQQPCDPSGTTPLPSLQKQTITEQNPLQQQTQKDRDYYLRLEERRKNRTKLTSSIVGVLDDWQMVSFLPLNLMNEDSLDHALLTINHCIQYGEDTEVRTTDYDDENNHDSNE